MLLRNLKHLRVAKVGSSLLLACTIAGFSLLSAGGEVGAASFMQAKAPCLFSEQLEKSVAVRKKYLVQLASVLGEGAPAVGSVDDMYGNIKPASFNSGAAEEEEDNFLGLTKSVRSAPVELDAFSFNCLVCHDGAGAVEVTVDWRNNPGNLRSQRHPSGSDHPIGMDYERYVSHGRDYKPVSALNSKMVFVNGKVGCLTCHNPLNQEKGHLVMSDRGSALCLTCHGR